MIRKTMMSATILAVLLPFSALTATIRVPEDYATIQTALNHALTGDTVLVDSGLYFENLTWPSTPNLTLTSYTNCNSTSISGNHQGPVIRFNSVSGAVVNGFTIRDGLPANDSNGGGISSFSSNVVVTECCFRYNSADDSWGGGGAFFQHGQLTLSSCVFESNYGASAGVGTALAINNTEATIQDCVFRDNEDPMSFSGVLSVEYAAPVIVGNTFCDNPGSGICLWDGGGEIRDNLFLNNAGYGINSFDARSVLIENNLFVNNGIQGVNLYHRYATSRISGNTIIGSQIGILYNNYDSSLTIDHNIVVQNQTGIEYQYGNPIAFHNNDIWGNDSNYAGMADLTGQDGNLSTDPMFSQCQYGDFFLSHIHAGQVSDSPCIDAGNETEITQDKTTRTDLVDDTGIRDLGYHYPIDIPPPTPTPHPTQTAVPPTSTPPPPTISPTPDPSPSPPPTQTPTTMYCSPGIEILMNQTLFQSGDVFNLDVRTTNNSDSITLDVFVILDVYGSVWFWPSWLQTVNHATWEIPAVTDRSTDILDFTWPENAGAADGLKFWAALTDPVWMTIVSLDSQEWAYR